MFHRHVSRFTAQAALLMVTLSLFFCGSVLAQSPSGTGINVLIVGGGSAHDFDKWYGEQDVKTLKNAGINAMYTEDPGKIRPNLEKAHVLMLANNKDIPGQKTRNAIMQFVKQGGGLIVSHAATWYNWGDWPEYNTKLVSGGAEGHVSLSKFTVNVSGEDHPILRGVDETFQLTDELYRFQKEKQGPPIHVLAKGTHKEANETHPVIWTIDAYQGRIVCNTLGHDGRAHKHPDYKRIFVNSVLWAAKATQN